MQYFLALLMVLIALIMLNCTGERRSQWYLPLEEVTVYSLTGKLAEARNRLALTAQSKQGERAKQERMPARQSLDQTAKCRFPVLNSRGHLAAAFHLICNKEIFNSKEEMGKARAGLTRAAANSDKENAKAIDHILTEMFSLQQIMAKADPTTKKIFNQITLKNNKLINSQPQPII